MIYIVLTILGLCFGSFVNALVFRLFMQSKKSKDKSGKIKAKVLKSSKQDSKYSIMRGRSMCIQCQHALGAKDLIPVFSWLMLRGKCRYCKKPISWQYPVVEILTAGLFIASYIFWPEDLVGSQIAIFGIWQAILVGFVALTVYDIRWMILPNRIIFPLFILALASFIVKFVANPKLDIVIAFVAAILVGGGIFYALFNISKGKWIGGGDVKLGFLIGAVIALPAQTMLVLFLASALGCLYILPKAAVGKLKKASKIPFGPFLIAATVISVLFGTDIINWYIDLFIN